MMWKVQKLLYQHVKWTFSVDMINVSELVYSGRQSTMSWLDGGVQDTLTSTVTLLLG